MYFHGSNGRFKRHVCHNQFKCSEAFLQEKTRAETSPRPGVLISLAKAACMALFGNRQLIIAS